MNLTMVTMTGADDNTNPDDLIKLSQEFPFVEWGILMSKRQEGYNRFPSAKWIKELNNKILNTNINVKTSAHLCGRWVRELLLGKILWPYLELPIFERVQLNFHMEKLNHEDEFFIALKKIAGIRRKIIFQLDNVNNKIVYISVTRQINTQGLFDLSGGTGITPETWPMPSDWFLSGYAGGLGPDNLKAELRNIKDMVGDKATWIDMETKIRSNNDRLFDLKKVRDCLEIAREFMNNEGYSSG